MPNGSSVTHSTVSEIEHNRTNQNITQNMGYPKTSSQVPKFISSGSLKFQVSGTSSSEKKKKKSQYIFFSIFYDCQISDFPGFNHCLHQRPSHTHCYVKVTNMSLCVGPTLTQCLVKVCPASSTLQQH